MQKLLIFFIIIYLQNGLDLFPMKGKEKLKIKLSHNFIMK